MLEQPAGEHGVGRFVHPLIHERGDFFPEICRVAKPRELEAFQRAHGCVAEILPREAVLVGGHKGLLRARVSGTPYYPRYVPLCQYLNLARRVDPPTRGRRSGAANLSSGGAGLAAPLQGSDPMANGRGQRAVGTGRRIARRHRRLGMRRAKLCSACAGDYENPEMTAPEGPLTENTSGGDLDANARGGPSNPELAHGGEYSPGTRQDQTVGDASWSGAAASPGALGATRLPTFGGLAA